MPVAQPGGRLLRNLLDPDTQQPESFIKEQDRRRAKRLGEQIYDVTAWSLPLAFDVEVVTVDRPTLAKATPLRGLGRRGAHDRRRRGERPARARAQGRLPAARGDRRPRRSSPTRCARASA